MAAYNMASSQDLRVLLNQPAPRPGYTDTSPNNANWNSMGHQWKSAPPVNSVSTSNVLNNARPVPNNWNMNRFIGRPAGWSNGSTNGITKKPKRLRTAFTSQQMMELEQEFSRTRYLDRPRRLELAIQLALNERTIKIWFQNRRMKEKKDRAESLESDDVQSVESSPEVGSTSESMAGTSEEEYYQLPTTVTSGNFNHSEGYVEHWPPAIPHGLAPTYEYYNHNQHPTSAQPPQMLNYAHNPYLAEVPHSYGTPTQSFPQQLQPIHLQPPEIQQPIQSDESQMVRMSTEKLPTYDHAKEQSFGADYVPVETLAQSPKFEVNSSTDSNLNEDDAKPVNCDVSWIRSICTEGEYE